MNELEKMGLSFALQLLCESEKDDDGFNSQNYRNAKDLIKAAIRRNLSFYEKAIRENLTHDYK